MESNSRSPIFSGFGELLEGIVTVRAFSSEKRFLDDLHAKVSRNIALYSKPPLTPPFYQIDVTTKVCSTIRVPGLILTIFRRCGTVSG